MLPLDPHDYHKARAPLAEVDFNNLFARSVVEGHVDGAIWVDHPESPATYYIIHPYGMTLLLGDTDNETFNLALAEYLLNRSGGRTAPEWMQVFPDAWQARLESLLGDKLVQDADAASMARAERRAAHGPSAGAGRVVMHTRVNFGFNAERFREREHRLRSTHLEIVRTSAEMFDRIDGTVIPRYYWKNARHFRDDGVGFTLVCDGEPISTAFSSFRHDHKLELGIETLKAQRGKGYAQCVCARLIDYCLERRLEPVWSCRLGNRGSYELALRLGFEPTITRPYYEVGACEGG
ncbi:MAG: GNAT family N-acetyltransferase [Thermoleophilia bacterium]|nr:GNAT family N-acetyltransferase [Thermoleophilia bacterium]